MTPKVSFVVPCYKLAHLLGECVESILSQTYREFEVLIMDDCSPDNTREVAQSFTDSRVKYIRNQQNLGHLPNYNKGIELARGEYIWLISADDRLRRPYLLERYVRLLEDHPTVGYVFCPGVRLRNGQELGTLDYSVHGAYDAIFDGRKFFTQLVKANTIIAASALVRRQCYEKVSMFPLNMPWAGDWYLWCVFALKFDVGYLAEPMVCYREHELSMTKTLMNRDVRICSSEDVAMPWIMRHKVQELGHSHLVQDCLRAAAIEYVRSMASQRYKHATFSMSLEQFEKSLCDNTSIESERDWIRSLVYARLADIYYEQGRFSLARRLYWSSIRKEPSNAKVWVKSLLLLLGGLGRSLRSCLGPRRTVRSVLRRAKHGALPEEFIYLGADYWSREGR